MKSSILSALLFVLPLSAPAQTLDSDLRTQIETYLNKRPDRPFQVEVSPDTPVTIPDSALQNLQYSFQKRMAVSGHGVLFDIEGNRVTLSDDEALAFQEELLAAARSDERRQELAADIESRIDATTEELLGKSEAEKDGMRRAALRHLALRVATLKLTDEARSGIMWRAEYILNKHILAGAKIDFQRDFLGEILLSKTLVDILLGRTTYMGDCDRAGVPVPPDFSVTGSQWTHQGNLTTNMLNPGQPAQVWSWAHPSRRGACIALPRGTGAPGNGLAGIICQGSVTGNACFWDNIDRDTDARIPWAGATLVISKLKDGTNLGENCTDCHRGDNVFLLAPDDPAWCRLMRGNQPGAGCSPPDGPNAANLTLEVEGVVNALNQPGTSLHHSRYFPMTGTPSRPAWVNNAVTSPGCGGICHLGSLGAFTVPPMPPACGSSCN